MSGDKKQTTVTLSFKDDELWVYEEICKHSSKGGWVKDVLKEYIRENREVKTQEKEEKIKGLLDF
jgi:hypothetical protein